MPQRVPSSICQCGNAHPSYGFAETKQRICCSQCRSDDMILLRPKCVCGKHTPSYGFTEGLRICCASCKEPGMITLKKQRFCECGTRANFGLKGQKSSCCSKCKTADMIIVNKATYCECGKGRAAFAQLGELKPRFCCTCRPQDSVNVIKKLCVCQRVEPTFRKPHETTCKFCVECKPVDAVSRMRSCECGRSQAPAFKVDGDTQHLYCKQCKPENACDRNAKVCVCGNCTPSFYVESKNKLLYCVECKPPNAISKGARLCVCEISSSPTFDFPGTKTPRYCSKCKIEGCVNLKGPFCKCGQMASFGFIGKETVSCSKCKEKGMVSKPSTRCSVKPCKQVAVFGVGSKRFRCETHKWDGDVNLVEHQCKSCGLMEMLDANDLCGVCNPVAFAFRQRVKEMQVKNLLTANGFQFMHNVIPNSTKCGLERPDFVMTENDHVVIVEVDEDQHKSYEQSCEQTRMINITQSYGGMPVFWIRYNPDAFKMNKSKRRKDVPKFQRERHLLEWIRFAQNLTMTSLGLVVYLYYDEYSETVALDEVKEIVMPL